MTAEQIMEELEKRVRDNIPISPGSWVEAALRINQVADDMDNLLANYEAEMITIEVEYLKQDMSSTKAKAMAKSQIDYKDYLVKKAMRKRINEFIMLAKRRSRIEEI